MAAIEFQNVVKRYGKVEALRGVSFSVDNGETVSYTHLTLPTILRV